jgi:hypothetical protein
VGPKQHADSLRPQEYGGIEYGGLPAEYVLSTLPTCFDDPDVHQCHS